MKKFISENKKVLLTIFIIFILVITGIIIFNVISNNKNNDEEIITNNVNADWKLEKLSNIDINKQPIMYDFINGTSGYHSNICNMVSDYVYIICSKNDKKSLFGTCMRSKEGDSLKAALPSFNKLPILINNNSSDTINELNTSNIIKKYYEDSYTFYVINYTDVSNSLQNYCGMNLLDLDYNNNLAQIEKDINNGLGYPTDLIRKVCNLDYIKNRFKVDFNDKFWDTANYEERLLTIQKISNDETNKVKEQNGIKSNELFITPVIDYHYGYNKEIDFATVRWSVNGKEDSDYLVYNLEKMGFESLENIINNHNYVNNNKANEILSANNQSKGNYVY